MSRVKLEINVDTYVLNQLKKELQTDCDWLPEEQVESLIDLIDNTKDAIKELQSLNHSITICNLIGAVYYSKIAKGLVKDANNSEHKDM